MDDFSVDLNIYNSRLSKATSISTVIRITKPPPKQSAQSPLLSNLSKSGLDNYAVKRSERPLLEKVS